MVYSPFYICYYTWLVFCRVYIYKGYWTLCVCVRVCFPCDVFVCFWYQSNTGFIQLAGSVTSTYIFFGRVCEGLVLIGINIW